MVKVRKSYNSLDEFERRRFWDAFKMLTLMKADDNINVFNDDGTKGNIPRSYPFNLGRTSHTFICQSKFD